MARMVFKLASEGLTYQADPEVLNVCRQLDHSDVEAEMEELSRKG